MDRDDLYMSDPRAKSLAGFIAGLEIMAKHHKDGLGAKWAFGAEHDCVHLWVCDLDALPEDSDDGRALTALGFIADEDLDQWQWLT